MKKIVLMCVLFSSMIFAGNKLLEDGLSKDTQVKILCVYKKIKDIDSAYDSEVIKQGIEVLQVGCMMIEHPVAKLLGAVLGLAGVGVDLYEVCKDSFFPEVVEKEIEFQPVFLPERFYFELIRKKLQYVKKDFMHILHVVCESYICDSDEIIFDPFAMTVSQEASCTLLQKKYLQYLREQELYQLQEDIVNLQYQIAWHFSELVQSRSEALCELKKVFALVCNTRSCMKHFEYKAARDQLVDLYAQELYLEKIRNIYQHHTAKLVLLIDFFKNSLHAEVLKKTSNIMNVISQVEIEIADCGFMLSDKDCLW